MPVWTFQQFGPALFRPAAHLVPQGMARDVVDANLYRGHLAPLKKPLPVPGVAPVSGLQSLFCWDSGVFLGWSARVSVARSSIPGDAHRRIYWTDGIQPRQTGINRVNPVSLSLTVNPPSVPLGIPRPAEVPSVSLVGTGPVADQVSRSYVYAWVHGRTIGGMSTVLTVTQGQKDKARLFNLDDTPPVMFGGKPAGPKSFQKWLFLVDASAGTYALVEKLGVGEPEYVTTGKSIGKLYKAGAFKSEKIAPPSDAPPRVAAIESLSTADGELVDRRYAYCWTFTTPDGHNRRTEISGEAVLTGVRETDQVEISGMMTTPPYPLPAGSKNIRKRPLRMVSGVWHLVGTADPPVTIFKDTRRTHNLGKPLSVFHLYVGAGGTAPAPVVSIWADPSESKGELAKLTRFYRFSYVTDMGEEGPLSMPSQQVDLLEWQTPFLFAWNSPVAPEGYAGYVVKKRLYRTDISGVWRFVADIGLAETYNDTLDDEDLGETPPSEDWVAPPANLQGLISLPGGFFAGFFERTVCFSQPEAPYAWPVKYQLTVDAPIVALASTSNGVLVLTRDVPYLAQGSAPEAMALVRLDRAGADFVGVNPHQPCVSDDSVAEAGGNVFYASPDGLVGVKGGSADLVTAKAMTREQWQALVPSTIKGALVEGRYVGFYNDGQPKGFIFDLDQGGFIRTSVYLWPVCFGIPNHFFHGMEGDRFVRWNDGRPLPCGWRSGRIIAQGAHSPSSARVEAENYPVTLAFNITGAAGDERHEIVVLDRLPFRLPVMELPETFDVEILLDGPSEVFSVAVASQMSELRGV